MGGLCCKKDDVFRDEPAGRVRDERAPAPAEEPKEEKMEPEAPPTRDPPDFTIEANIDKSSEEWHKGFKKRQWFRKLYDKQGNCTGKLPLTDALCSILNNCQENLRAGHTKLKDIPIGGGWVIDVDTEEQYHLADLLTRTAVYKSNTESKRLRPPDN